jgi:N-acetylneuraminic acid mutarotase
MYSNVYALAVVGQDLYVGGDFSNTADDVITGLNGIAKYDSLTHTWSALPDQGLAGYVEALAVIGTDLYVGGWFTETYNGSLTGLGRIARFSISENKWYALPNIWTYSEEVIAFAVVGNDLYVGGTFYYTVDSVIYNGIAKFSGGAWSALPKNWLDGRVDAFAINGNDLYVCGQLWVTPDTLSHIFRFDLSNSTWFPLPNGGLNGTTSVFALIGSDLYVGGQFSGTMDGQVTNLNHIARFDINSSTWFALPNNGLNGNVFALAAGGTDLYVGGDFTNTAVGNVSGLNHIAMFNTANNTWSALSNGGLNSNVHNGNVRALTVTGGYLVVGGQFDQTTDGEVTGLNHIASYSAVSSSFDIFLPLILR